MVFASSAPDVRLELDDPPAGVYDPNTETTVFTGRLVIRVHRASTSFHSIWLEFAGIEAVSLRAWAPLPTTTVQRQVVSQRIAMYSGGVLQAGQHFYAFRLAVPSWVPSSLDAGDLCHIRYVLRAVMEGGAVACETEVTCRRLRVSRRLARRKLIDQSVGCPDGSCHVRFTGSLSRDVVRPGAQLILDVVARTSDPRFGLRLVAANFAECVMCHVQVRGEQRMVNKISNLATVRLDALDLPDIGGTLGSDNEAAAYPRRHLTRGIRKTRSRLAVLLRNNSASPGLDSSVPSVTLSPPQQNVVRQIRASQIIHVPSGLSQFSSEYVSREYRVILVAEVAPLNSDSNEAHSKPHRPSGPPTPPLANGKRSSSASFSSVDSLAGDNDDEGVASGAAPASPRWTVSEHSSAIAGWPVEIVERFDVRFDELVAPATVTAPRIPVPRDAELVAGEYTFHPASQIADEPLSSEPQESLSRHPSSSPASLEHKRSADSPSKGHHRRTSSGLVGFLMRGFRSSSSAAPSIPSPPPPPPPPPASESEGGVRRRLNHVRSVSSVVHGSRTKL